MSEQPVLGICELRDSNSGRSGCREVGNVSGLSFKGLQSKHCDADNVSAVADGFGVGCGFHDYYSLIAPGAIEHAREMAKVL